MRGYSFTLDFKHAENVLNEIEFLNTENFTNWCRNRWNHNIIKWK